MTQSSIRCRGCIVATTLRDPEVAGDYCLKDWERLISEGRSSDLLGQLRYRLQGAGALRSAPQEAVRHLEMAWRLSLRHREAVLSEVKYVEAALAREGVSAVLLKGAAYSLMNNLAAQGRVFNDVDVLVPKPLLKNAELALMCSGWLPQSVNAYDQRYYRKWMHELPPMEHKSRGAILDVHHTIVPPTSGILINADVLIKRAMPIEAGSFGGLSVLAPEDMLLHSASHLFFNEFNKGLRDLYDLSALFAEFGAIPGFWQRIVARSFELGLARPLLDAMEQTQRVFGTTIPPEITEELQGELGRPALGVLRAWMLRRVMLPDHPAQNTAGTRFARWLGFVRSHWLRMPLPLLVYHLSYKAFKGRQN